jgi:hypothetical protein
MNAQGYMKRHKDNAGAAWLRNRGGGDIKGNGVGYTNDLEFDRANCRTNAKDANTAYLRDRHGKGSQ